MPLHKEPTFEKLSRAQNSLLLSSELFNSKERVNMHFPIGIEPFSNKIAIHSAFLVLKESRKKQCQITHWFFLGPFSTKIA